MDGLAVDGFPERGTFVVGEGIEEGFAEGGIGGEVRGGGWGGEVAAGAVVVVAVRGVGGGVSAVGALVGGGVKEGRGCGTFAFEAEGFGGWVCRRWGGGG